MPPLRACRRESRRCHQFHTSAGYPHDPVFRYASVTMTEDDVQRDTRHFIIENFLFGDESAAPDAEQPLVETGLVDSTGVLEVAAYLDTRFGVKTEDDELAAENFGSIQRIARFVVRKIA